MILGLLTSAAFMATCVIFNIHGYRSTLEFAALVWLMVPLPLTITNALFIKLHPLIVVSHRSAGSQARGRSPRSRLAPQLIFFVCFCDPIARALADLHSKGLKLDTRSSCCMIMQSNEYSRINAMGAHKRFRQGQILKLLASQHVASQDELRRQLVHLGVRATQATLSRDLRELRLVKTAEGYRALSAAAPRKRLLSPPSATP